MLEAPEGRHRWLLQLCCCLLTAVYVCYLWYTMRFKAAGSTEIHTAVKAKTVLHLPGLVVWCL